MISTVTALVQFGTITTVEPGPAVASFADIVALTIVASGAFDPRLMVARGCHRDDDARGRAVVAHRQQILDRASARRSRRDLGACRPFFPASI
jgi:hypothetical protein